MYHDTNLDILTIFAFWCAKLLLTSSWRWGGGRKSVLNTINQSKRSQQNKLGQCVNHRHEQLLEYSTSNNGLGVRCSNGWLVEWKKKWWLIDALPVPSSSFRASVLNHYTFKSITVTKSSSFGTILRGCCPSTHVGLQRAPFYGVTNSSGSPLPMHIRLVYLKFAYPSAWANSIFALVVKQMPSLLRVESLYMGTSSSQSLVKRFLWI